MTPLLYTAEPLLCLRVCFHGLLILRVCMCVCVCSCVSVWMLVSVSGFCWSVCPCVYVCVSVCAGSCVCVHTPVCVSVRPCVCARSCVSVRVFPHMCLCACSCASVCTYVPICVLCTLLCVFAHVCVCVRTLLRVYLCVEVSCAKGRGGEGAVVLGGGRPILSPQYGARVGAQRVFTGAPAARGPVRSGPRRPSAPALLPLSSPRGRRRTTSRSSLRCWAQVSWEQGNNRHTGWGWGV